jgi:hypothetical protein
MGAFCKVIWLSEPSSRMTIRVDAYVTLIECRGAYSRHRFGCISKVVARSGRSVIGVRKPKKPRR